MNSAPHIDVLNRLVVIHNRSLASYLGFASPTWHRGDEEAEVELKRIVADQQEMVDRFGQMVVERDGAVDYGAYPMAFTSYNDLSFDFLLDRLIEDQKMIVAVIEKCVAQLAEWPREKAQAQEALGLAKGHLQTLEELKSPAAVS